MGTRKNHLGEAILMCTHNHCFEQTYGKNQNFSTENLFFTAEKISVIYCMGKFSSCNETYVIHSAFECNLIHFP